MSKHIFRGRGGEDIAELIRPWAQVSQELGSQAGDQQAKGVLTGHLQWGAVPWAVWLACPRSRRCLGVRGGGQLLPCRPGSLCHVTHFSVTSESTTPLPVVFWGQEAQFLSVLEGVLPDAASLRAGRQSSTRPLMGRSVVTTAFQICAVRHDAQRSHAATKRLTCG